MVDPIIIIPINEHTTPEELIFKEWLVTNGRGGYASGSVLGVSTRRYHGLFIPNLSSPRGRTMMIPYLEESVLEVNRYIELGGNEFAGKALNMPSLSMLKDFRLDWQTPTWVYEINNSRIEKKIFMPYGSNTVYAMYQLLSGPAITLRLRPYCACRKPDNELGYPYAWPFTVTSQGNRHEITAFEDAPVLRLTLEPYRESSFETKSNLLRQVHYRKETSRGLDDVESIFSPAYFQVVLKEGERVSFVASTESWELLDKEDHVQTYEAELQRRRKLVADALHADKHLVTVQLTLAADQFIILPQNREEKNALNDSYLDQVRTINAGYHWFTDWGRDTMISLEGLTLYTGRADQARAILQTFGHYVKNGLLPNHFPEGWTEAVYNTVDATFWYFHAIDRYLEATQDTKVLEILYPTLQTIIEAHMRGTDFGIHMDMNDGLIVAAAEGFQLTWMDAKVDEWVVTPRRGKPVEIQALWYNALKLMVNWSQLLNRPDGTYATLATRVYESFNKRFWFESGGYLYDVIDTKKGDDPTFRPNQIFAISLRHAVLKKESWQAVVDTVEKRLFTPYGLRTLDPADKNYHGKYEGSRWDRDAAYHQGLVWPWLLGPFLDAWKKVYNDPDKATQFLSSIELHLQEEGIGTISEIFDGNSPYHPRGCIAQAWSVAESLRCFMDLNKIKNQ